MGHLNDTERIALAKAAAERRGTTIDDEMAGAELPRHRGDTRDDVDARRDLAETSAVLKRAAATLKHGQRYTAAARAALVEDVARDVGATGGKALDAVRRFVDTIADGAQDGVKTIANDEALTAATTIVNNRERDDADRLNLDDRPMAEIIAQVPRA